MKTRIVVLGAGFGGLELKTILSEAFSETPAPYDGAGSCYVDFGGQQVGRTDVNFLNIRLR